MKLPSLLFAAATFAIAANQTPAAAQDVLKIAVPQRGAWDTSVSEIGDHFNSIAVLSLALHLTGSGAALGLVMIARVLPAVLERVLREASRREPRGGPGRERRDRAMESGERGEGA